MKKLHKKQQGFTLVELSIVIVIIGVLIGGMVLGGRMIESSKLAKFASEINSINRAVILYKDTYNALPGDDTNASTAGNGNGFISDNEGIHAVTDLISQDLLADNFKNDTNKYRFPASYGDKIQWQFETYGPQADNSNITKKSNIIKIFASTTYLNQKLVSQIDGKVDDGYPESGVLGFYIDDESEVANCLDTNGSLVKYDTNATDLKKCFLAYKL
jgi:prepilin-type N-terminal cleavage/methylation domain-containing protein